MRSSTRSSVQLAALVLVACSASCLWSKFDDFKHDTPVYAFTNRSFGGSVGLSTSPDGTTILASAGAPGEGARFFALRDGRSDPSGDPISNDAVCVTSADFISSGKACINAANVLGLGALVDHDGSSHPGCFALGYGKLTSDAATTFGPLMYCTDGHIFTLGQADAGDVGTKGTAPQLTSAFSERNETKIRGVRLSFASLRVASGNPPLLMGDEADNAAYYFATIGAAAKPVIVGQPSTPNRYGHAVGFGQLAGASLLAVAAPGAGKVYAYTVGTDGVPTHVACAGDGAPSTGEAIAVGDVDGDRIDDLLASSGPSAARVVQVYLGKDLPATAATGECSAAWPPSTMSFRCEETRGAAGCASSDFGRSIAIGDVNKDGAADVAIGAPSASAGGTASSGVVFLYTPTQGTEVKDVRFLGQPESGAGFGSHVVIGAIGGQDTLAVSGSGKAASYVVWCNGLPGDPPGARCRR